MSVTARGQFSILLDTMATLLSNCTAWQGITQTGTAAAALVRILVFGKDSSQARPYAILFLLDAGGGNIGGGSLESFLPSGKIQLAFEIPIEWTGTITTATSASEFKASGLAAFANDTFNGLELTITPTGGAQQTKDISDFVGSDGTITLGSALAVAPTVGDTFTIQAANAKDSLVWFCNILDDIITNMKALTGTGGYPSMQSYSITDYGRPLREGGELDNYCVATLELVKGDSGGS